MNNSSLDKLSEIWCEVIEDDSELEEKYFKGFKQIEEDLKIFNFIKGELLRNADLDLTPNGLNKFKNLINSWRN